MNAPREGLKLIVRAKGSTDHFYDVLNPLVIPRMGDFVQFNDGRGRVESVTWDVLADPLPTVTVECVPAATIKPGPAA